MTWLAIAQASQISGDDQLVIGTAVATAVVAAGTAAVFSVGEARKRRDIASGEEGKAIYHRFLDSALKHANVARYATLVTASFGLLITLFGVLMMFIGHGTVTQGAVSSGTGVVMEGVVAVFYRFSTQQLKASQESFQQLREDQRREYAMGMANDINDAPLSDAVRAVMALHAAGCDVDAEAMVQSLQNRRQQAALTVGTVPAPANPEQQLDS